MAYWDYGLTGYLAPDGTFYFCEYQEHQEKAKQLVEKYGLAKEAADSNEIAQYDFLKFGCAPWLNDKTGDHMCHVFISFSKEPSPQQLAWLDSHWRDMTYQQSLQLMRGLKRFKLEDRFLESHQLLEKKGKR